MRRDRFSTAGDMKIEPNCVILVLCSAVLLVSCTGLEKTESNVQGTSDERTLIIGKLVLVPILAGIGLKVLMLLPIVLSKIALLGVLSFVSSNLSLLISAIVGTRHFFFGSKLRDGEHRDYDYVDYRDPYLRPDRHRPAIVNHDYVHDRHRGKHGAGLEIVEPFERAKDDDHRQADDVRDDVDRAYRRDRVRSGSFRPSNGVWTSKDRHYHRHYAVGSSSSSSSSFPGSYEIHEDDTLGDPRKRRR